MYVIGNVSPEQSHGSDHENQRRTFDPDHNPPRYSMTWGATTKDLISKIEYAHRVLTHYIACFQVKPNRLLMAAEMLKTRLPKNNKLVIQSSVDMLRSYEY